MLSMSDIQIIREKLIKAIKDSTEIARDSQSEELFCLNIDWLKIEN